MQTNGLDSVAYQDNSLNLKEQLYKYLANWPVFLLSLMICISAGWLYSRYTIPKYMASCTFLVKEKESSSGSSNDLIEEALNGKRTTNLNNEMLAISSSALMERVVTKNNFNIGYHKVGQILNIEVYLNAPFRLMVQDIKDSILPVTLVLKNINEKGGNGFIGTQKNGQPFSFHWYTPFMTAGKIFILTPYGVTKASYENYMVSWRPVETVAAELSAALSISPFDTKTSAIELSLKSENLQKGKDILNAVIAEFNSSDIEDRTRIAENTVQFIDNRLNLMSGELKNVEGNLEEYQGSKQVIDIKGQSAQSLDNTNETAKTIKDIAMQNGIASMILEYFQNPANNNKLVPSSLGLKDATLTLLVSQYNELQLKKEREAPSVAPNSTVMEDINAQLANLRSSILESLRNIIKNLGFQQNNFQQQNSQYSQFLSSLPHKERELQEIKRKQSISEGLYLYLLQKREEAAISGTGSRVPHYKLIDPANGYGPVEPNTRKALIFAIMLGLFFSFGFIYIKNLFNDKVSNRLDVTSKIKLPIFGEISHIPKREKKLVPVVGRDIVTEQFRTVRTNLSFLLKTVSPKIILVTSSSANEGKSFVSLNLAAVCAARGKKVALLEFDIRKPVLAAAFNFQDEQGIIQFLAAEENDLSEIRHSVAEIPGLDIYPCGPIPLNGEDLLLTEKVSCLFKSLQSEYDYIVVDSPPAALFSDAFILGEYSSLVLYIIRQGITLKKELEFINEINANKKLSNIHIVINDVKTSNKYGYHNYGYGKPRPAKQSQNIV